MTVSKRIDMVGWEVGMGMGHTRLFSHMAISSQEGRVGSGSNHSNMQGDVRAQGPSFLLTDFIQRETKACMHMLVKSESVFSFYHGFRSSGLRGKGFYQLSRLASPAWGYQPSLYITSSGTHEPSGVWRNS